MKLLEKVAIVTGGGGGLGKETCLLFAKEGASVVVADYDFDKAVAVHTEISKLGFKSIPVKVNVADRESVDSMVSDVISNLGKVDILINNAGITKDKTLLKLSQEDWQDVLDVNLTGVMNCARAVSPHMVSQGSGRIVNISSVVGKFGNIGQSNYSASKAGVIALAQTWAKELGRKGINVNAVAPGFILSPMTDAMPPERLEAMKDMVALKRLGKPSDVAKACLFLSCEDSEYVNGTTLSVDGGLSL